MISPMYVGVKYLIKPRFLRLLRQTRRRSPASNQTRRINISGKNDFSKSEETVADRGTKLQPSFGSSRLIHV